MRDWEKIEEQVNTKIDRAIDELGKFREGLLEEIQKEKTDEMARLFRSIDKRLTAIEEQLAPKDEVDDN